MTTHQALLNAHGMKATSQRLCILKQLERLGHATLEDIYEGAKPLYPTLSLTTVYRNLGEMMGKGLVDEVQIPRHPPLLSTVRRIGRLLFGYQYVYPECRTENRCGRPGKQHRPWGYL